MKFKSTSGFCTLSSVDIGMPKRTPITYRIVSSLFSVGTSIFGEFVAGRDTSGIDQSSGVNNYNRTTCAAKPALWAIFGCWSEALRNIGVTLLLCVFTASCSTIFPAPAAPTSFRPAVAYGYQPIDPVPVAVVPMPKGSTPSREQLMDALPDETMRMAIGQVDISGGITYGPASVSASNSDYIVTIDYVKSNTESIPISFLKDQAGSRKATLAQSNDSADAQVPVYVGVGLRLTANIRTTKAGINLGNLIALGVSAQAGDISGTLVVQTLGLSGENISTALPIPTDLTTASIQTAIQALGTMKAKLYDTKTSVVPRVVGVYNNLGGGRETIDGFVSSLLAKQQLLYVPGTLPTSPEAKIPDTAATKAKSALAKKATKPAAKVSSPNAAAPTPPVAAAAQPAAAPSAMGGPAVSTQPALPATAPSANTPPAQTPER